MKLDYDAIMLEAEVAAEKAGDKWFEQHTKPAYVVTDGFSGRIVGQLLDVCGFGYVEITDRRNAFAKYIKKRQGTNYTVYLKHKYNFCQEWSLNEETARAAIKVFKSYGIECARLYSRID